MQKGSIKFFCKTFFDTGLAGYLTNFWPIFLFHTSWENTRKNGQENSVNLVMTDFNKIVKHI